MRMASFSSFGRRLVKRCLFLFRLSMTLDIIIVPICIVFDVVPVFVSRLVVPIVSAFELGGIRNSLSGEIILRDC
jgi:hypothetical protein